MNSALFLTGLGGAPTLVHDCTITNNNTTQKDQGESRNNTVASRRTQPKMTTRRSARLAKNVAATNEDVNARLATDVSTPDRLRYVDKQLQDEEYFNRCVAKGGSTNNVLREILKYNYWRHSGRKTDRGILVKNLNYIYETVSR